MPVTPHDAMTERMKEIVEKARRVSSVIEAARRAALIAKGEEEATEEVTPRAREE